MARKDKKKKSQKTKSTPRSSGKRKKKSPLVAVEWNAVQQGDCLVGMGQLPDGCVDLAFADPPFNIGYKYDIYEDRLKAEEYVDWCRQWTGEIARLLKPSGAFWLAIGDEFAAELKVLCQREHGLSCRSWVVWYYTFGVNCKSKFSRSHAHLFHFVKDPRKFTFNDETIRVPSARQLVYGDGRAHPKGRLPDDTWILRPQDAPDSFRPDHDTWFFPRVAGTFKERAGFHGCQMPEQLLGRIVRACSHEDETVFDPFAGSGTTLAVAKKLGRQFLGFELSADYAKQVNKRLDGIRAGDPLNGSADPLTSAPTTAKGRRLNQTADAKNERERSLLVQQARQAKIAATKSRKTKRSPVGQRVLPGLEQAVLI